MTRAKLVSRLSWYFPTERLGVFMFLGIMLAVPWFVPVEECVALLYGLSIMTFVLFQGQRYWDLKLRRLTGKSFDERRNLYFFHKCKQWNLRLIAAIPLAYGLQYAVSKGHIETGGLFWASVLANIFGILEHVNYYHTQLMIDKVSDLKFVIRHKRLKRASLGRDLQRSRL